MREVLRILMFVLSMNNISIAQSEGWKYCLSEVQDLDVTITSEVQSGDSIFKTFTEDFSNDQFEILFLNDTLYSKYNGTYYFLGTNNPRLKKPYGESFSSNDLHVGIRSNIPIALLLVSLRCNYTERFDQRHQS